jgi:hypothetical protein
VVIGGLRLLRPAGSERVKGSRIFTSGTLAKLAARGRAWRPFDGWMRGRVRSGIYLSVNLLLRLPQGSCCKALPRILSYLRWAWSSPVITLEKAALSHTRLFQANLLGVLDKRFP